MQILCMHQNNITNLTGVLSDIYDLTLEPECEWSEYLNDYDGPVQAFCRAGYVLAGLHSVHDDKHEDRMWKMKCCKVKCDNHKCNVLTMSKS